MLVYFALVVRLKALMGWKSGLKLSTEWRFCRVQMRYIGICSGSIDVDSSRVRLQCGACLI